MRVVILGSNGQLGAELTRQLSGQYELVGLSHSDLDITKQEMTIRILLDIRPDLIINTAALTDVDGCETNREKAMEVNSIGACNVAKAARETRAKLFHFSTDYVFSGNQSGVRKPYREDDPTEPINVYGKSKLAGEKFVTEIFNNYLIIRVSWLYSNRKDSFLLSMLKLGEEQLAQKKAGGAVKEIYVVNDQIGSPTWVKDLSCQIEVLIDTEMTGIIHSASVGEVSRFGLVKTMFDLLEMDVTLHPCNSERFNSSARRPKYTPMENYRLKKADLNRMHHWKESLTDFLNEYKDEKRKLPV